MIVCLLVENCRAMAETGEHQIPWGLRRHWQGFRFLIRRAYGEAWIPLLEFSPERSVERAGPGLEHEMRATF